MREIVFRGKRTDNGEWVYGTVEFHLIDGDLTKTKKEAFITFDDMDTIGKVYRTTIEVIPETVGQYTGLKDKNGKDIYEGDIVKAYKHGDIEKPACEGEITFNNGCFCFRGYNWHEFLNWFRMIEVVGNIYEQEVQNAE